MAGRCEGAGVDDNIHRLTFTHPLPVAGCHEMNGVASASVTPQTNFPPISILQCQIVATDQRLITEKLGQDAIAFRGDNFFADFAVS